MFPVCDIVTRPAIDAPIVVSLNDVDGPVRLLKSVGGSSIPFDLGEPPNGAEDRRSITIGLRAVHAGNKPVALAAFSRVAQAVSTPGLWLRVQLTSSSPSTWFKLLPASPGSMDFSRVYTADDIDSVWAWDLELDAVGYGYGARVTLPAITVTNTALGATIPVDIEGDAPTFAQVTVRPLGDQDWGTWRSLVNVTPVLESNPLGAPTGVVTSPLPPVITWEAEAFTLAAGSALVSGSGLSGGSGVSFDETDGTWRLLLSGTVPVKPPPGTYQVLARLSRSSAAGGCRLRVGHLGWNQSLDNRAPVWQPAAGSSLISWVTLGELSFPAGQPLENLTIDDVSTPQIRLYGRGLALGGANNKIVVDRFALVPVRLSQGGEGMSLMATWATAGPLGEIPGGGIWNSWRVDGDTRRNGLVQYDGKWYSSATPPLPAGDFPVLHPGMRNIVSLLHTTSYKASGSDVLGASCEVTVSYHPRVAHLAS